MCVCLRVCARARVCVCVCVCVCDVGEKLCGHLGTLIKFFKYVVGRRDVHRGREEGTVHL